MHRTLLVVVSIALAHSDKDGDRVRGRIARR